MESCQRKRCCGDGGALPKEGKTEEETSKKRTTDEERGGERGEWVVFLGEGPFGGA